MHTQRMASTDVVLFIPRSAGIKPFLHLLKKVT